MSAPGGGPGQPPLPPTLPFPRDDPALSLARCTLHLCLWTRCLVWKARRPGRAGRVKLAALRVGRSRAGTPFLSPHPPGQKPPRHRLLVPTLSKPIAFSELRPSPRGLPWREGGGFLQVLISHPHPSWWPRGPRSSLPPLDSTFPCGSSPNWTGGCGSCPSGE